MMTKLKPLKALSLASSFAIFAAFPLSTYAAQSNMDLLASYIGTWKGLGNIIWHGGETEAVKCRVEIKKVKQQQVNYRGRCAFAGGNFSISGAMAYIEEKKHFEAVMSSSTSFSGVAIGERDGDNIIFQLNDRNAETGDKLKIDSDIKLIGGELFIGFTANNITTGKIIKAKVPFSQ